MTSTETRIVRAKAKPSPLASQKPAESTAMTMTTGTKYPEMISASRAMGALVA